MLRFARQKIERAHVKAERKNDYCAVQNQEELLVQSKVGLAQSSRQEERNGESKGKAQGLCHHEPEGSRGE